MAVGERLICASSDLLDAGAAVRFSVERHGIVEPAFVVRYGGAVYAYLNRCAHVPVELDWQPGQFFDLSGLYLICATHGALYSPASGSCLEGRCNGKGLIPLSIVERDGHIFLKE
ncbi:MAG: Rieske 2Fe-2S domain-containing protein [Sterolibacterium sp.]|nr:Rieske 2Fe-2S domain-containing protein [Sterolibacterium sp.]